VNNFSLNSSLKKSEQSAGERQFSQMSESDLIMNYHDLLQFDFQNLSLHDVSYNYFKFIPVLPTARYKNPPRFPPQTFYRAVKYSGVPTHIDMLSYPDPRRGINVKRGRANWEGLPVLYGCTGKDAVLKEVRAKDGELVIMSKWRVDLSELTAGFLVSRLKSDKPDFIGMREYIFNSFCKNGSSAIEHKRSKLLDIWNDLFLAPKHDVSAFISWGLLYAPEIATCDYIIYPSIADELNTVNYALHPKVADTKKAHPIKFLAFYFFQNFGQSKFLAVGYPYNDEIRWSGKLEEMKDRIFYGTAFPEAMK